VSWVVDEVARRCSVLMSFVAMKDNNNTVDFAFAWLKSRKGLELRSGAPADHRSDDRSDDRARSHWPMVRLLLVKNNTCTDKYPKQTHQAYSTSH
jgi:hypothetical protein